MPELPEVETMVRDLEPRVVGRTIVNVDMPFEGEVRYPSPAEFRDRVQGRRIEGVSRRGKYARLHLDSGDDLIIHRGMSGSLLLREASEPMEGHVRTRFDLDDGRQLRFNDPRKFGNVYVMARSGGERPMPWARMGPEPLDGAFTPAVLAERLRGRTAKIKPLLLNQDIVAGLGNIYVDESLYMAQIHPERRADTLTKAEIERLHSAIVQVLGEAVGRRGTTFMTYMDFEGRRGQFQDALRVFRKEGTACPRCETAVIKTVVGGRGTHFCPTCQKV